MAFKKVIFQFFLFFTTMSSLFAADPNFTVAKDGSGDFKTVQEAIYAVPDLRKNQTIIFIKKGVYKEKLVLPNTKINVKLIGEQVDKVILTFDDYATKKNRFGEAMGTSGSASFFIHGDDFTAENISFQNSAGPVGQAVAVRVAADRVKFLNCKFLGFQDTLYTWGYGASSRQYYKNCYIEGTVDFIFGSSTAIFDQCHIYGKSAGYFTAASTPDSSRYGYVFIKCKIEGNAPPASFYLGRPWRPYAKTVFIDCSMSDIVKPEGWHNWNKFDAEKTTFYAEYETRGKGANSEKRVSWSHQLTKDQAAQNNIEKIFKDWKPND
ncbi:MAG TPA: pectinesterase family protein [Niabella sp.]|nr:pectinesterase family protein [Niabella sp.]HOZ97943.1 pectinesterase family protein [Niabella sp.]HQW15911.1 pectinesterase family protein [Niabella sp.]HQX21141.1 pectinesterase family protein [Niabella sp.]HQX40589.1 pectinesterase family protein [Niabella sp.]